jgi:hypothetical protein
LTGTPALVAGGDLGHDALPEGGVGAAGGGGVVQGVPLRLLDLFRVEQAQGGHGFVPAPTGDIPNDQSVHAVLAKEAARPSIRL